MKAALYCYIAGSLLFLAGSIISLLRLK